MELKERDRRIIDAVLRKAETRCPGALELLGVYGSARTGDDYDKSDVDLMIVAEDERGRVLTDGFILDDTGVGYDLYLTRWESLEEEADCSHARISKLMDAEIVYCRDAQTAKRLEALWKKAAGILASEARFERAERLLQLARQEYAEACLADELSEVRTHAGDALYWLLDALMLWHGRYYRLGVKRTFDELAALELPFSMEGIAMSVILADSVDKVRSALTTAFITLRSYMHLPNKKAPPTAKALAGTYEEMVSNWRNKMREAAERGDVFSSFMNLGSLQLMLRELSGEFAIEDMEIMGRFDAWDLVGNAEVFDAALERYSHEYVKLGMEVRRFADLEAFLAEYLPEDTGGA